MSLPAPTLDDRRFQHLVDEAKRQVQQRCPEWTDHNVSDPGVTLIELFAWMTDQVVYRLNRVPDLNYVKFLELIGVTLFPPTAAHGDITFWLSVPREQSVTIEAGTVVSTERSGGAEVVAFSTVADFDIVPCSLARLASTLSDGDVRSHADGLEAAEGFYCFDEVPKPGDALLLGLSNPVPSCAVLLRFDCTIEGIGVDPKKPPLVWEAWDGSGWTECELASDGDGTGGLNRAGDVVLHVPASHQPSVIAAQRAGWLRCRVVEAEEGRPRYSASPRIKSVEAFTIGGTVAAVNAERVVNEVVGISEGIPGQRFDLRRRPLVLENDPRVLEVVSEVGQEEWEEVRSFADSGPESRHFLVDEATGELFLGPAVREPDGALRRYGAAPPKGSVLRLRSYRTGGGRRGNVASGKLMVLRSSIQYVSAVENRHPARGGVDGEDVENAKLRGPIHLRTGSRAVTAADYEQLAREAAPEIARVRCVQADEGADPGAVRVLVVPAVGDEGGRVRFEQLIPSEEILERIAHHLDERRVIGARVSVEPPLYQGVTVVAKVQVAQKVDATRLQNEAVEALFRYFSSISGGPDGSGWPFGRPVVAGEVYAVLQGVKGVALVEDARLFAADPTTGERGKPVDRIDLPPHALVFSYDHQVRAEST